VTEEFVNRFAELGRFIRQSRPAARRRRREQASSTMAPLAREGLDEPTTIIPGRNALHRAKRSLLSRTTRPATMQPAHVFARRCQCPADSNRCSSACVSSRPRS
jgi:hypothetical protein